MSAPADGSSHGRRALVAVVVLVPVLVGQEPPTTPSGQSPAAGSPWAAPVRVVDVAAADPDDPRGSALAASVLPLVLAGMAAGLLVWLAGVLGLTVLAVGATVTGLAALFGRAGAALGALLMVLVGNPLSGVSSAPELLPEPAGAIGQLLPPGAGGSLLRSTAFFDGAAAGRPLVVLAAWVELGLVVAALWPATEGPGAAAPGPRRPSLRCGRPAPGS